MTILIEVLAPDKTEDMTAELTTFLDQLKTDFPNIANSQTSATSNVISIDISEGFNELFYAYDFHYNAQGADFVATKYYDVLSNILQ